jgi:hypothetical protein
LPPPTTTLQTSAGKYEAESGERLLSRGEV